MDILRFLHSWVRWLVVIVALVDLVYFGLGWLQSRPYNALSRRLAMVFSMSISIQWLIGVLLLIVYGSTTGFGIRYFWEHLTVMTIAVFVANLPSMLRRRQFGDRQRNLVAFLTVVVVLVLVVVGISVLPEVIRWRFYTPG